MSNKYSTAKRLVQTLGLREFGASFFSKLPLPLSAWTYRAMRALVFRDNNNRLDTFRAAFGAVRESSPVYVEFGVARGTSMISAHDVALEFGLTPKMIAFDSFAGLPSEEGNFRTGEMAYSESVFRRFVEKAGVDMSRLKTVPGFFSDSLDTALYEQLEVEPGVFVAHIDCDLYESTVDVLRWLEPLLADGSVIIFDDWFAFDEQSDPASFGEQRAFDEWSDRNNWELLYKKEGWNIAFVRRSGEPA